LPGIYLQTDADRFFVFDHVEAKVARRDSGGVTVVITNPTKYDARVAVFAESAARAAVPLAYTAYLKWPRVEVKAGESKQVLVKSNGAIQEQP
jgi:hypothetical protein